MSSSDSPMPNLRASTRMPLASALQSPARRLGDVMRALPVGWVVFSVNVVGKTVYSNRRRGPFVKHHFAIARRVSFTHSFISR